MDDRPRGNPLQKKGKKILPEKAEAPPADLKDMGKPIHELQAHEFELERQKAELLQALEEIDESTK